MEMNQTKSALPTKATLARKARATSLGLLSYEYCVREAAATRARFYELSLQCTTEENRLRTLRIGESLARVYDKQVEGLLRTR